MFSFLKRHVLLHFPLPLLSPKRRYICCHCAVAHHHRVPFQAHLLLSVRLCVVRSSISPLGFLGAEIRRGDQSASPHAGGGDLGPRRTTNDGEDQKKVRSGKESMPPLPGQTLHLSTSPGGQKKREVFSILPPCCLRWLVFECERQLCESHTAHQKSEAVVVESQKASFMLLPL